MVTIRVKEESRKVTVRKDFVISKDRSPMNRKGKIRRNDFKESLRKV